MESKIALAAEQYRKVREIVQELSDLAIETNSKFKFSIAMRQFDYILQISLIYAAISDDDFKPVELSFVRDITEYGSVVGLFNSKMKDIEAGIPELTWENLEPLRKALSEKGREAFLKQMTDFVEEIANDFVKWFAPIDAKKTKINYLTRISSLFDEIINIFTTCDGDESSDSTAEADAAKRIKRTILINKWKKAMEEAN